MTADELARALERGQIPDEGFHHASHLTVAWVYLLECSSTGEAAARMAATLRRFAASVGQVEKYHHTITVFWVRRLAAERASRPGGSLHEILTDVPALLDKRLPLAYYSSARLFSDEARASWLEPDVRPLDTDAASSGSPHPPGDAPDRALPGRSA
jgi:hypothetical protein